MSQFRLIGYGLAALALVSLTWWVANMRGDLRQQATQIERMSTEIKAEQAARAADIAGLTSLTTALVNNSAADKTDQEALSRAIDKTAIQPVSPGLRALFDRLRAADENRSVNASARPR